MGQEKEGSEINMTTIIRFKSTPENWKKEEAGFKRNTVRTIDIQDKRFKRLSRWKPYHIDLFIEIKNTETKEEFQRLISDVTFWENLVIISW